MKTVQQILERLSEARAVSFPEHDMGLLWNPDDCADAAELIGHLQADLVATRLEACDLRQRRMGHEVEAIFDAARALRDEVRKTKGDGDDDKVETVCAAVDAWEEWAAEMKWKSQ